MKTMGVQKHETYYLAHPATTYGELKQNKENSSRIKSEIVKKYDINVIDPLSIFHETIEWDKAMESCYKLISICAGIILSPKWSQSKGCLSEAEYAMSHKTPIFVANWKNGQIFVTRINYQWIRKVIRKEDAENIEKTENYQLKDGKTLELIIQDIDHKKVSVTEKKDKITVYVEEKDKKENGLFDEEEINEIIEKIDQSINFENSFPEKYHELLQDRDILVFIGKQKQLCFCVNDEEGEIITSIYFNKFDAAVIGKIISSAQNEKTSLQSVQPLIDQKIITSIEPFRGEHTEISFKIESDGDIPVSWKRHSRENRMLVYDKWIRENSINGKRAFKIWKDDMPSTSFCFSDLQTECIRKLIQKNYQMEMNMI